MSEYQLETGRYLVDPRGLKFSRKFSDIVVIGGGIAGSTASIAASEQGARVVLVGLRLRLRHSLRPSRSLTPTPTL